MDRPVHRQKTLSRSISTSGVGLFTGHPVTLTLMPAPPHTGIVFERSDLPGKPEIPAHISFVQPAPRTTKLATEKASVLMVEHLLAALFAYEIDNLRIGLTGPELPSGDGSSRLFVDLIEEAGIEVQEAEKRFLELDKPLFWSEGDAHLIALPSQEFRLSYTLHYPHAEIIGTQYYTSAITSRIFKEQISACRTFALYEELVPFLEKGLLKGSGLSNGLVFKENRVLNPEGARFPDEPARHKVLDLLGDLALLGVSLRAHILAVRSGHASHAAFAKILANKDNPKQ